MPKIVESPFGKNADLKKYHSHTEGQKIRVEPEEVVTGPGAATNPNWAPKISSEETLEEHLRNNP